MTVVMVIDDEASARQTTEALLVPDGYRIDELSSGAAAIRRLGRTPPDLVICDVMMPGLDGFEVCRAIKADPAWQFVPVILLTAFGEHDDIVRAMDAGADQFVTKPVEGAVLRARVRSMLRARDRYLRRNAAVESPARRLELVDAAQLTEREREVLELLLLGRTHVDISEHLGITVRTSKFHQTNLLTKLGAESRFDLLRLFSA